MRLSEKIVSTILYNKYVDGSFGIIFNNKRKEVILVKRRDIPVWDLPGGGVDLGEKPEDTVKREVLEETGFEIEILRKVGNYYYRKKDICKHTYECKIIGGKKVTSKESKAIEYHFVSDLPDMCSPRVHIYIADALKNSREVICKEQTRYPFKFIIKGFIHPWAAFKYILTRLGIHWNT